MSEDGEELNGHGEAFATRMEEIEEQALRHRIREWLEESNGGRIDDNLQSYRQGIVDALNQAAETIEWYPQHDPLVLAGVFRVIAGRKEDRLPRQFRALRFGDERLYSRDVLYREIPGCTPNKLATMKRRGVLEPDVHLTEALRCVGYRWESVRNAFALDEEWRERLDEAADALAKERNNEASYRQMALDHHAWQENHRIR